MAGSVPKQFFSPSQDMNFGRERLEPCQHVAMLLLARPWARARTCPLMAQSNFAKTGDPNAPEVPQWLAFKPGGGGQVMELGARIGFQPERDRDRYEFLDELYRKTAVK